MEKSLLRSEILLPKELGEDKKKIIESIKETDISEDVEIKVEDDKILLFGEANMVKKVEAFLLEEFKTVKIEEIKDEGKFFVFDKKLIRVVTPGQKKYVEAIEKNNIIFSKGPAGTGKSFLAIAVGLILLRNNVVKKMILTRPVVEAGEKLGFLPGDIQQKVDPYIRPLYDFLEELLGQERLSKLIEKNILEVAPLAYMRGRTFKEAFVLLDEAQNTTPLQIKMFLTRFGFGSKMVVTGDVTQTDLGNGEISGLMHAWQVLQGIKGVAFVDLTDEDIVRHDIVREIVKAYERWEKK
ncbi:MAG TPA: PhoH family protein [Dictyoglomaceae bacterium]|nr:PhoH family protein [Dictyoglomaceae bacterium]HOL38926.1 PhoH family protein [Dictyoglomaceae bacterium]HOP94886.1 PhoH family protein [Dictyoglomaceae bacterium]